MGKFCFMTIVIALAMASCETEAKVDQTQVDEDIIKKFIADKNLSATATGSGLYYVIDTVGTGDSPTLSSQVKVHYTGYLTDNNATVFDQTDTDPLLIEIAQTILGWQEGIPLFKEGGKGLLIIPSALGYGTRSVGNIPANSVLVFNIDLVEVL